MRRSACSKRTRLLLLLYIDASNSVPKDRGAEATSFASSVHSRLALPCRASAWPFPLALASRLSAPESFPTNPRLSTLLKEDQTRPSLARQRHFATCRLFSSFVSGDPRAPLLHAIHCRRALLSQLFGPRVPSAPTATAAAPAVALISSNSVSLLC